MMLIACAWIVSLAVYGRKGTKKPTLLRENEAQLKPHQQKHIEQCLERLQRESFEKSLELILRPQPDNCSSTPFGLPTNHYANRTQFTFIFFDRRKLKLNSHIEQVPESERSQLVSEAFQKLLTGYNRRIDADFRTQLGGPLPDGVVWAMYATARFGTPSDVLKEIDQVRVTAKAFYEKIIQEGRVRKPSPQIIQDCYPDNRVMLNCMVIAIKRLGAENVMSEFLKDLRVGKLAIPQWDALATMAEAGGDVLEMNALYPGYVHIGDGWEEHILYDWPNYLRLFEKKEEQDERLTRMIERFRKLIAK